MCVPCGEWAGLRGTGLPNLCLAFTNCPGVNGDGGKYFPCVFFTKSRIGCQTRLEPNRSNYADISNLLYPSELYAYTKVLVVYIRRNSIHDGLRETRHS